MLFNKNDRIPTIRVKTKMVDLEVKNDSLEMNNSGGISAAFSHQVSSSLAGFLKNLIKNVTKNLTLIFFIVFLRKLSF